MLGDLKSKCTHLKPRSKVPATLEYPQEDTEENCLDDLEDDFPGECGEVLDIETEDAEFMAENVLPEELSSWPESSPYMYIFSISSECTVPGTRP